MQNGALEKENPPIFCSFFGDIRYPFQQIGPFFDDNKRHLFMRLALFEPDIPQNTGTILRLAACFKVSVDIIEPCGFVFSDRRLKRSGMDYIDLVDFERHDSWEKFLEFNQKTSAKARIILLTTKAETTHTDFEFSPSDILLLGRESAGVPENVHKTADARILIPMTPETRSLNIAVSAAMVLGEALRQTDGFPKQ
jgi:tRNA (cytidine/uridine-2'-O-)-methyltransferase